jgi:hypothetical protein
MNFRTISLIAAAIAAPAISNASPEQTSLEACAHTLATSVAENGASTPVYRVASHVDADESGSIVRYYSREYTFEMKARDPKTGQIVARATCTAKPDGTVTSFSRVLMTQPTSTVASR